ncbi:hypothetical protein TARUN_5164 [Trichoderma arundinaceum]|uniref:Uncharacterized protein n=1 Tax=Trichoderma arundinaceum TaxID=490622 RepID=A0A395NLY8_TRIAR|nr:hypothetical protein TARUN_5164 [Trichoderma arundinaceum]
MPLTVEHEDAGHGTDSTMGPPPDKLAPAEQHQQKPEFGSCGNADIRGRRDAEETNKVTEIGRDAPAEPGRET